MSDIKNEIKQALEDINVLPWQYRELHRNIEYDAIQDANGTNIICISSYDQANVDFLLLTVNNISSLITTIESQQTQISGYKDVYHNEWLKQSAEKDALIESQKEEIELIKFQLEVFVKANNVEYETRFQLEEANTKIESLKASTELAVNSLTDISTHVGNILSDDFYQDAYFEVKKKAFEYAKEINRLQNE